MKRWQRWTEGQGLARRWIASFAVASGLAVSMPGAAQEMRREDRGGAAPASAGLPANIPVKRDASVQASADTGDYAWAAILVLAVAMGGGVLVMRRKLAKSAHARSGTQAPGRASPWGGVLGGLLNAVPSQEIQRMSSTRLTPRHSLHVVVWNGRRLLIGCSENSIELMAEATSPTVNSPDSMVQAPAAEASS